MINVNATFCWSVGAPPPLSPLCRLISITAGQGASGGRCRRKGPQEVGAGGTNTMAAPIMVIVAVDGVPTAPPGAVVPSGGGGSLILEVGRSRRLGHTEGMSEQV